MRFDRRPPPSLPPTHARFGGDSGASWAAMGASGEGDGGSDGGGGVTDSIAAAVAVSSEAAPSIAPARSRTYRRGTCAC